MQKQRAHIGHHGPELLEDGTTRFRLWAPDAQNVSLIVVGAQTLPMTATEEGWYSIDAPYGAGTLYRFLIDDELHVPDPASRAQAGDVHAQSRVEIGRGHVRSPVTNAHLVSRILLEKKN